MTIPEQAIDAAAKAIADSIGHGMSEKCFDHARAALTAAAPYMQGSAREQALEEAEHAVGSTVLKHQPSDYSGLDNFEAYEAGQLNGLERAQASLRALKSQPAQTGGGDEG